MSLRRSDIEHRAFPSEGETLRALSPKFLLSIGNHEGMSFLICYYPVNYFIIISLSLLICLYAFFYLILFIFLILILFFLFIFFSSSLSLFFIWLMH